MSAQENLQRIIDVQRIIDGDLTGDAAVKALREAIPVMLEIEKHAWMLRGQIKEAEDLLLYGQLGRPGNELDH